MMGCEKSGVGGHFMTFLKEKGEQNHLISFRGHRFNHLFCVAGSVYHHRQHIQDFLSSWADPNDLLKSVSFDIREKGYISSIRALGIIDKMITGPLWKLIESVENVLALNPYLLILRDKLSELCGDASPLLKGEPIFPDVAIKRDQIYESLFSETDDPVIETYSQMALELALGGMLLILERQAKDQLPGGKFFDPPITDQFRASSVPPTNTCSERDFAQLDMLMRAKPSASTECYESIIMWTNNKTSKWLSSLDSQEREKNINNSRKAAPEMMQAFKNKQQELFNTKLKLLREKQEKKAKQENKLYTQKVKLTGKVNELGGLWVSKDEVLIFKEKNRDKSGNFFKDAFTTQLQFRKQVLGSKGPKEKFQLQVKGHQFTVEELEENLIDIITLNEELENEIVEERSIQYKPLDQVSQNIKLAKEKLVLKLEENRKKIQIDQQKHLLPEYIKKPDLLVGKKIKQKFRLEESREIEWFRGEVLSLERENGRKSRYRVKYEDEDDCVFTLLIDIEKGDIIVC
ncbi:uncharacterized protein LOC134281392 [Saccostrea cucullata]|uniref:uncharacterized protein LOC134281392 n=1 Tax=Saccostrea cuccullata TaxID=36930 RepID=UPI002ED2ABDC